MKKRKRQIAHVSKKGIRTKNVPKHLLKRSNNPKRTAQTIARKERQKGYKSRVQFHKVGKDKHYDVYNVGKRKSHKKK